MKISFFWAWPSKRRLKKGRGQQGKEQVTLMEVGNEVGGGEGGVAQYWPWAVASAAQLAWGIFAFRRGYAGDSRLMPLKAFAVASLFLGASSTAAFGTLRAFGIHSVEDMKEVGAGIRTGLGVPRRAQDE